MAHEHQESTPVTFTIQHDAEDLSTLRKLFEHLKTRFPTRKYNEILKHFQDEDFRGMSTYVAKVGNTIAGAFAGVKIGDQFEGSILYTDPDFVNKKIGARLIGEIMKTNSQCILNPVPLGRNPAGGDREGRKEALIRYYKGLGFTLLKDGKMTLKRKDV